jgi:hypothetical protein
MSKTRFMELYDEMIDLANAEGLGDPFTYGRGKEIYLAQWLGHSTADTLAGADGVDENGAEVEYKSTINKNITATYNGVSVQDTWEEQVEYLKTKKIGKYHTHYFSRFDENGLAEVWSMDAQTVLDLLLPKLEKQFFATKKRSDPRLGAHLSKRDIHTHGTQLL